MLCVVTSNLRTIPAVSLASGQHDAYGSYITHAPLGTGTRADERFTERHSRLPRRRRRLSTIGMRGTKRGSSGEAGAVGPGSPSPRNRSEMGPESERYKTADSTEGEYWCDDSALPAEVAVCNQMVDWI